MSGPDPRDRADVARLIEEVPMEGPPARLRTQFETLAAARPMGRDTDVGGVPARVFNEQAQQTVIWLHGGGYVFGSSLSHARPAACLAGLLPHKIVLPDYPLAPEHQWPAQLEDACTLLDAIEGPVSLVGDSAGGHLAISLALARPGRVSRLALIGPNTDRSGLSKTRHRKDDPMNDDETDAALARLCFGDRAGDDPALSPVLADLSGLPPTYLTVASNEVLLGDTLLFARAAGQAGVHVSLDVIPPLWHMWTLWPDALPQARTSLRHIAGFIAG
ncbi:MAG: alpha/beta hydrolase fold domain-containing protein [Sulfitobacter sp.]|nr:alpha/beta hydrolase fold domain-containing protein [Sulfitobacter sp.]